MFNEPTKRLFGPWKITHEWSYLNVKNIFVGSHIESNFAKSYPHFTYLSCKNNFQTLPCEELYLDKRNIFIGSHIEHHKGCSNNLFSRGC